jgi:hypothetical protein
MDAQNPPLFHEDLITRTRIYCFDSHGEARPRALPKGFRMRYGDPETLSISNVTDG